MTHNDVEKWVDRYVDAWRSSGTSKLASIFSSKINYSVSPWKSALKGLTELERFWGQARSGPEEAFRLQSEVVAVESKTAVVRVEVEYAHDTLSHWRSLWIMTFDENGLCSHFEEWPFAPAQDDGQIAP